MSGKSRSVSLWGRLVIALLIATFLPQLITGASYVAAEDPCANPANDIVAENCLTGNPPSEWDISGAGDVRVQGFATDISVNRGGTISFKIGNTANPGSQIDPVAPPAFSIEIYRLGYYDGNGARLVHTIADANTTETNQPACSLSAIPIEGGSTTSGQLLDCGNWSVSASWTVPAGATSGVYIAKPTLTDNSGASHIPFIVRDDASDADLLFQTSDTTWQSYNPYGGYNAYGSSGAVMAEKLSYNRPFATRGAELENYLFNAEYPMIRWLERNGFDVSYMSAVDVERYASLLLNHKVYLSVGHDEYWSQGRRDAVTAARDAGKHLAFFSANEIYWKIRWEASTADGGSTDYRTQVVYKEGSSAPSGAAEHRNCYNNYECDPTAIWTGQWREAPGYTPENSLSGQISWRLTTPGATMTIPGEYAPLRFWRDTAVAALGPTDELTLGQNIVGYEWDPEYPQYADWYPAGRVLLSTTNLSSFAGLDTHHLSLYRATSGALVFGAGTVQWSWGLDANHDYATSTEDTNVQQATVNLLADMGVQPENLQDNLIAATASVDATPPTVAVSSPPSGSSVPGGAVTITGTASDAGGAVGVVEVSTDGGTTWRRATGRENWSYTYNAAEGTADIRVRAADDSINLSAPVSHTFEVQPRECPCSIWPDTATPASTNQNDGQGGIEVGVKFQTSQNGYITGLRYYWAPGDSGVHTGNLWSAGGQLLATAVFPTPTIAGWQQVTLANPVPITAGITYVASQHASTGNYSVTDSYFATEFANPPLTALADGADGANGVYKYGATGFPTSTSEASNYWVDVVFDNTPQTYSIWEEGAISGDADVDDPSQVELGMKFKSDVSGSVTGLAFYKGATNTGQFLGHLWTLGGSQLAEKSYTNNTAEEGWQVIIFDTPVAISADTTYVVSYFTESGNYAADGGYFTSEVYNPPLRALANDDPDGPNGVFLYAVGGGFPTDAFNSGNYWVDVLFSPDVPFDNTPPTVLSVTPTDGSTGCNANGNITARFSEDMDETTINGTTFELRDAGNNLVAATISYAAATRTAVLDPTTNLAYSTTYTAKIIGGAGGVTDAAGNELAADYSWTFTTSAPPPPPPYEGPGGPILVVTTAGNPFGTYFAEILRAEGLNAFAVEDIANVDATLLSNYDVVILGEMALTSGQVTLFSDWVTAGGNLIAMRPDPELAGLLGLTDASSTLANAYLLVNTVTGPGVGIVGQTIQFHGTADLYTLNGATALATLYADATTATAYPAVTLNEVGSNGGQAAAFTFDLARSVVYTRQGNPAWIDINGDGSAGPVRADDLFHNGTDSDWVDLDRVAIPQADEQQRLLANMITSMNLDTLPLPRFWYFPRGEQAVVVMTHDEHGGGDIVGRLNYYNQQSPVGCNVADWECIRSTTYMYTNAPITNAQVAAYQAEGHEFNVHINTNCANYTVTQLEAYYTNQIPAFSAAFPSVATQTTQRTHCIAWSGWALQPTVQLQNGMRLDTNYYYWPDAWIQDRPGLFTGSGMPMRFADLDGTMIDVYQATTQMTDESGQTFPFNINTLLDSALGATGYYGAFTTNIHTDGGDNATQNAEAIVQSALDRGVPVVSAAQMLEWLDGRNGSSFANLTWSANTLTFEIQVGAGANGLQAMVPAQTAGGNVSGISIGGSTVAYSLQTIKGIRYAIFDAGAGVVAVTFDEDTTPPVVNSVSPADNATDVPTSTEVTATFNEPMDPATINDGTFELRAPGDVLVPATVTYNAATNTATLTPDVALDLDTSYAATVVGGASGVTDFAGNPLAADVTWSFTTSASLYNCPCTIFEDTPGGSQTVDTGDYELGVKFQSNVDGWITGVRFYKPVGSTGTHIGKLWNSAGVLLSSATFVETSSGWQEVSFASPVAITANTTYIASYSWPGGFYAFSSPAFESPVTSGPLTALQNGGASDPNGVFNEIPGLFPTSGGGANYFADVIFITTLPGDTTQPVISNVNAVPGANGTAVITWDTDEPADSLVDYGLTSGALDLSESDANLVTAHTITLNGLAPNTTYYYQVTSADAATNSATSTEASFTTPAMTLADTSLADFGAAVANACYLAEIDDGEIILIPTIGTEFTGSGSTLPTGWSSSPWATGGTSTLSGGLITVDGARAAPDTYYAPGRSLEFEATFQAETYEHVGFGQLLANVPGEYWAMFGTYDSTSGLFARTNNNGVVTDTGIDGSWLGTPHRYRIEWTASQVLFYIDGSLVHTANVAITQTMRPVISDFNVGGASVSVDWLHMSPYSSPCSLTSRVFDAGETVVWDAMSWTSELPAGTSLNLSYRLGDTPTPDGTWSGFIPVGSSPASLGSSSRYIQYKADLATTDGTQTPILQEVSFANHAGTDTTPPTITVRTPAPGATGVARDTNVAVTFSEPMDAATITAATFTLRAAGSTSDLPATVTYANGVAILTPTTELDYAITYQVAVASSVADRAGNTLGAADTWSFTTLFQTLEDTSTTDFLAGSGTCKVDPNIGDGAVRLAATVDEGFSGSALPPGWESDVWGTGGSVTVGGGSLTLDYGYARTSQLFSPGHVLEFVATFSNQTATQNEHAGFGYDLNSGSWAIFSTGGASGGTLKARSTGAADTDLGTTYLGSPHRYRIEWGMGQVVYYVDGSQVASHSVSISDNMRPIASDGPDSAILSIDWMLMSPFTPPCAFTSRVFDAGEAVLWDTISWISTVPGNTSLAMRYRSGDTATPDGSWTEFQQVAASGAPLGDVSRYIQYKVDLGTTDTARTPVLEQVSLTYGPRYAVVAVPSGSTTVGAGGGAVLFQVQMTNYTGRSLTPQAWIIVDEDNGPLVVPTRAYPFIIPANSTVTLNLGFNFFASDPTGDYTLTVYMGDTHPVVVSSSSFSMQKTGSVAGVTDGTTRIFDQETGQVWELLSGPTGIGLQRQEATAAVSGGNALAVIGTLLFMLWLSGTHLCRRQSRRM